MSGTVAKIKAQFERRDDFVVVPFFTGAFLNSSDENVNIAVLSRLVQAVNNDSPPLLELQSCGVLFNASTKTREQVTKYLVKCVSKPRLRNALGRIHCEAGWMVDAMLKSEFITELANAIPEPFVEPENRVPPATSITAVDPAPMVHRHRISLRQNVLGPVLKMAKESAPDPENEESVWFCLVRLAQQRNPPDPIVGYAAGGEIRYRGKKYFDSNDEFDILTRNAHRDRWYRAQKKKLA